MTTSEAEVKGENVTVMMLLCERVVRIRFLRFVV